MRITSESTVEHSQVCIAILDVAAQPCACLELTNASATKPVKTCKIESIDSILRWKYVTLLLEGLFAPYGNFLSVVSHGRLVKSTSAC